jgi:hypothetical protein
MPEFDRWKADADRRQAEMREAYTAGAEAMRDSIRPVLRERFRVYGVGHLIAEIVSAVALPEPPDD